MKNNLKTKVMLAVLAGGMLCANGAWATVPGTVAYWFGTEDGFVVSSPSPSVTNGVDLAIGDTTTNIDSTPFTVDKVANCIYGGHSNLSPVTGNSITFNTSATTTIKAGIYGGYSGGSVMVTGNTVTISNGTFNSNITGGYSSGIVGGDTLKDANKVIITNGTFNGSISIYGGRSGSANAKGNIVTIKGGTFSSSSSIYGGFSQGADAKGNIVTIEGGTFNDGFKLYGGMGTNSTGNILNLKTKIGGKADEVSYFQMMNFDIPKGMDTEMTMLNVKVDKANSYNGLDLSGITFTTDLNDLSLTGNDYITLVKGVEGTAGALSGQTGYYVLDIGGTKELVYSNGTPTPKGDYTIKQGEKKWSVPAANSTYYAQINGNVDNPGDSGLSVTSYTNNEIIIRRGTYKQNINGANDASSNEVKNNKVSVYGGTIDSGVFVYGGYSSSGNATNNSVIINDGTFNGSICGGEGNNASGNEVVIKGGAINGAVLGGKIHNVAGTAEGNIVTIDGGTFKDSVYLYGGMGTTSTGNILNLKTKIGGKANEVKYFQTMNFTLPAGIQDGDTMLKTTALAVKGDSGGSATVNVRAADGVKLKAGAVITLVDSDNTMNSYIVGDILGGAAKLEYEKDGAGKYLNGDGDTYDLVITLLRDFEQKSGGGGDQQKAPAEGVAAAAAMVNVSADLASGEGMDSMLAETAGGETNTFGAVSAGRSKFKTGSHVDVDGWGVVVGAGKTKEWTNGSATTMGIFLEYGKGDFDTYNGVFHGDGDTKNHGVGVMARHKTANNNYYEGNIRYGRQETSWGQSEIGGYETDSRYYGVMVGMGHIIQLGKNELDVYGRYSYGHVGACNAKVGDNDYRFDSVKSHRVRVGGKYNFVRANSKAKPFVGVAWEHEFNGESKATIAGVGQAPAPGLKGNTGIIQAGCDWDLGKKWTAGAGVNAYVGKRKGWDGMLRAFYSF